MGKYDALGGHLRRQRLAQVEVSFTEIERIIHAQLPRSAERSEWWANDRDAHTHVQSKAWREAGYAAFLLVGKDRVRFERRS